MRFRRRLDVQRLVCTCMRLFIGRIMRQQVSARVGPIRAAPSGIPSSDIRKRPALAGLLSIHANYRLETFSVRYFATPSGDAWQNT